MALSKEQKVEISKKLGEAVSENAAGDLQAAGGFVWCKPCPYYPAPNGCWTFVGDCPT